MEKRDKTHLTHLSFSTTIFLLNFSIFTTKNFNIKNGNKRQKPIRHFQYNILPVKFLRYLQQKMSKFQVLERNKNPCNTFFSFQYNNLLGSFFTRMAEVDHEQRKETKYKPSFNIRTANLLQNKSFNIRTANLL